MSNAKDSTADLGNRQARPIFRPGSSPAAASCRTVSLDTRNSFATSAHVKSCKFRMFLLTVKTGNREGFTRAKHVSTNIGHDSRECGVLKMIHLARSAKKLRRTVMTNRFGCEMLPMVKPKAFSKNSPPLSGLSRSRPMGSSWFQGVATARSELGLSKRKKRFGTSKATPPCARWRSRLTVAGSQVPAKTRPSASEVRQRASHSRDLPGCKNRNSKARHHGGCDQPRRKIPSEGGASRMKSSCGRRRRSNCSSRRRL
jgi:hypothetical protein